MAKAHKSNNQDIEVVIANDKNYSTTLRPVLPNPTCKKSIKITIEVTEDCEDDDGEDSCHDVDC